MSRFVEEFRKFIMRGNVVDLAVGVVIGAAFAKIVDSLVADIFMPVIGLITGGFNIAGMHAHLYGDAVLRWGNFLQAVLNFVIIGFCLFLIVKGVNTLQHRFMKEEAAKVIEPTTTEKLLAEIRDALKSPDSAQSAPISPASN
jgi:large conductance mechanosensitive channel